MYSVRKQGSAGLDDSTTLLLTPGNEWTASHMPILIGIRYSNFHDWRNHVKLHRTCLVGGDDNPLLEQRYAAGLMANLDRMYPGWRRKAPQA